MRKLAITAITLVLLFTTNLAIAQGISNEKLEKIIALSGLEEQMAGIAGAVKWESKIELENQKISLPESELARMNELIDQHYSSSVFVDAIAKKVKQSVSEDDARQIIDWLESDQGKLITKAEVSSSSEDFALELQNALANPSDLLSDKVKTDLIKKIERAANSTQVVMDIQEDTLSSVASNCTCSKSLSSEDKAKVRNEIAASLLSSEDSIRDSLITSFLVTYRKIPAADLALYANHLEQPYSNEFNAAVSSGLREGFDIATQGFTKAWSVSVEQCEKGTVEDKSVDE